MSEQAVESSEQPPAGEAQNEPETFDADYVAKLRKEAAKYRTEAKANAEAAKRLAEIEEANKTEAQRAADELDAARREAEVAKATAARWQIVTEFQLSKEDAEALEHVPSEEGMRALAARLASKAAADHKNGNHVPREGTTPAPPAQDPVKAFAGRLFERATQT